MEPIQGKGAPAERRPGVARICATDAARGWRPPRRCKPHVTTTRRCWRAAALPRARLTEAQRREQRRREPHDCCLSGVALSSWCTVGCHNAAASAPPASCMSRRRRCARCPATPGCSRLLACIPTGVLGSGKAEQGEGSPWHSTSWAKAATRRRRMHASEACAAAPNHPSG